MASPGSTTGTYRFGECVLDLNRGALMRNGADVPLRPKSYAVLCYLVEHHGQLVTKQELLDAIWGHTAVTEGVLTQCLIDIRRALGDDAQQALRTIRGRGYLFDVPVEHAEPGTRGDSPPGRFRAGPDTRRARSAMLTLAVLLAAAAAWWLAGGPGSPPAENVPAQTAIAADSIAVLPFSDLSPAGDQAYFSHGLSEEILNRLSSFHDLHVIARTSSFALAESGYDVPRLAHILGVEYLLQGSVRKDGPALRISAQLVDRSGRQVWSEVFDREHADIFAVQTEIAEAVATRIVPQISAAPTDERMPDLEAYEHYLVAREIVQQRNYWQFDRALELLDRAIALDPDFAEAHLERAITLTLLPDWPEDTTAADAQAQGDLNRALSLKPGLARAHAAQWLLLGGSAEPDLRKALALDPNSVDARTWLANALTGQGRLAQAEEQLHLAARIDPLSPRVAVNLSMYEVERGDIAAAEERIERLLELPQPSTIVYEQLWRIYVTAARLTEAADIAARAPRTGETTGDPSREMLLMQTSAYLGLWEEAEAWQAQAENIAPDHLRLALNRAWLQVMQGRHQEALAYFGEKLAPHGGPGSVTFGHQLYYGQFVAISGAYDDAIAALEPVARRVASRAGIRLHASEALQWLAWTYQQSGQPERARELLDRVENALLLRQADGRLDSGELLYQFALNALLYDQGDVAIDRLQQAVDAGWRDYYAGKDFYGAAIDPRWQPLRDDAEFMALMAAVKADVDAQGAEVRQRLRDELIGPIGKQPRRDSRAAQRPNRVTLATAGNRFDPFGRYNASAA